MRTLTEVVKALEDNVLDAMLLIDELKKIDPANCKRADIAPSVPQDARQTVKPAQVAPVLPSKPQDAARVVPGTYTTPQGVVYYHQGNGKWGQTKPVGLVAPAPTKAPTVKRARRVSQAQNAVQQSGKALNLDALTKLGSIAELIQALKKA